MCTVCDSTNINTIMEFVPNCSMSAVMVSMAVLIRIFSSGLLAGAPVSYVTKTWSVVLLKKMHILLSQVYCV